MPRGRQALAVWQCSIRLMNAIRIGTRGSPLALWQARFAARRLMHCHRDLEIQIVPVATEADRRQDVPLSDIGGKGLFIKELERALLDGRVDIAVHSMKDVTVNLAPDFQIPAVLERANPYDALVSVNFRSLDDLPLRASVGTCSLRRQCQLLRARSDLQIRPLRGNVQTRLKKLEQGEFDATLLAVSGLQRLQFEDRICEVLRALPHIPSPGQGALGIECRDADSQVLKMLEPLNHPVSQIAVEAERAVNRELGGHCHAPIGIHAVVTGSRMHICGSVGTSDGRKNIDAEADGPAADSLAVAAQLAARLKALGAEEILRAS